MHGLKNDEELVIPGCVLEEAGHRLFLDQDVVGLGPVQTQLLSRKRLWLLRRMELRSELPLGSQWPPLTAYAVIVPAGVAAGRSAAELARIIQPRMNQRLIVLVMGVGGDADAWDGVVVDQLQHNQLTRFQILESQMPTAVRSVNSSEDRSQLEEFSRVIGGTSEECMRAIRRTIVAVVGAGRNGSRVVHLLAGFGFGWIYVIDGDVIEDTNLDAMDCVVRRDVGHPKAVRVGRFAHRIRPEQIVVSSVAKPVTSAEAIAAIQRSTIVITAVDSDVPRLFVSMLAARYLKPHLDIACGVVRTEQGRRLAGDIRFMLPGDGCLHCSAGGLPGEDQARHELLASPNALPSRPEPAWNEQGDRMGSLGTLNSMACGMGVQVLLDFLEGNEELNHSFWQRFEWVSGRGVKADSGRVGPDPDCEICRTFR